VKTIACSAPYGTGGLGQHLAHLVEDARADGSLLHYYAPAGRRHDDRFLGLRTSGLAPLVVRWTPARFDPGARAAIAADHFDRSVACVLIPGDTFVGFAGQALRRFRQARRIGYQTLELVSPTCHVDYVRAQYAAAHRIHPIERPWLNEAQRRKCLKEYEAADVIRVPSEYARRSFLEAGFDEARLRRDVLSPDERFVAANRPGHGRFDIVYTGALTVAKGVPVLLDAFARFGDRDARLTLVGGWTSRGMRRLLERWCEEDGRLRVAQGDSLPYLQRAAVYVHPSWQDGWGLAPAEAMACNTPVVVTEDTGMKESVGELDCIVPTGSADAILECLHLLRSRASPVVAASA